MIFYLKGEMMKSKILIGLVLGALVSPCFLSAKTAPQSIAICSGSNYTQGKQTNKVNRSMICGMMAMSAVGKLVIKQTKNPCLFVDKEYWEREKARKVNANTVEWTEERMGKANNIATSFYDDMRPDLGHNLVFHNDGKITHKTNGREVIQILGTDKKCYLKPTTEEWLMYEQKYHNPTFPASKLKLVDKVTWYLTSERVPMTKEKFYKGSDKPNGTNENSHIKSKTTNKKKQETRIRIYKYGAPDGFGKTFNSASDCEAERVKLTESHKGLDYEYKCEKK